MLAFYGCYNKLPKPGWLIQHNLILLQLWGSEIWHGFQETKIKMSTKLCSHWRLRGQIQSLCFLTTRSCPFTWAHTSILYCISFPWFHHHIASFLFYLKTSFYLTLIRTPVMSFRVHSDYSENLPISRSLIQSLEKFLFLPYRVTFTSSRNE